MGGECIDVSAFLGGATLAEAVAAIIKDEDIGAQIEKESTEIETM